MYDIKICRQIEPMMCLFKKTSNDTLVFRHKDMCIIYFSGKSKNLEIQRRLSQTQLVENSILMIRSIISISDTRRYQSN